MGTCLLLPAVPGQTLLCAVAEAVGTPASTWGTHMGGPLPAAGNISHLRFRPKLTIIWDS